MVRYTIHVVDDRIGAGNDDSVFCLNWCLHCYVIETSVVGKCFKHKDIGQAAKDILCAVNYTFELHNALLVAFVSDEAILVVKKFVRIITIYTSLGEESEVHFHIFIFTSDAETILLWLDGTIVERYV